MRCRTRGGVLHEREVLAELNCMLEVKFAKQSGVGMIPVMMEGGGGVRRMVGRSRLGRCGSVCPMSRSLRRTSVSCMGIQGMVGAALAVEESMRCCVRNEAKEELSGCGRIWRRRLSRRLLGLCWPSSELRRFLPACRSFHLFQAPSRS